MVCLAPSSSKIFTTMPSAALVRTFAVAALLPIVRAAAVVPTPNIARTGKHHVAATRLYVAPSEEPPSSAKEFTFVAPGTYVRPLDFIAPEGQHGRGLSAAICVRATAHTPLEYRLASYFNALHFSSLTLHQLTSTPTSTPPRLEPLPSTSTPS